MPKLSYNQRKLEEKNFGKELTQEEIKTEIFKKTAAKNIDNFVKSMKKESYSENTISSYKLSLEKFSDWLSGEKIALSALCKKDILGYKNLLDKELHQSAKTINLKLNAIKKYNEFLIETGAMENMLLNKKDMIKIQTKFANPNTIDTNEITSFLNDLKNADSQFAERNYNLAYLMATTGIRIQECLSIEISDINFKAKEITIRSGKGNKQRTIFLKSECAKSLKSYLKNHRTEENYGEYVTSPYLFISKKSHKMTTATVNDIFKSINKKFHPHVLRHWFCTNCLESGMGIHEVAYCAGHSNIQTTLLYTNPNKDMIKSKLSKISL